jgi:YegS/Rv2252/BmrU family lipid kinase
MRTSAKMKNPGGKKDRWLVVVNPNAGRGLGRKDWEKIVTILCEKNLEYDAKFTRSRGDAIQLTQTAIGEGYRNIMAVGGDGTINEVINGCFQQKICPTRKLFLSVITIGTGNDWGRMFSIPEDYEKAIQVICEKKTCLHDTGVVYYYHGTKREKRYFINIAGMGFDAIVVQRTNRQKEKGHSGKALYMWNLLKSLLLYSHTQTEVVIDGNKVNHEVFTISLGIGRYSGGGMMQTPRAVHDDGLFDITIIKKIRKGEVIRNLKLLYNGRILDHSKVEGYKGRDILIDSDPLIHLEVDGESLGHSPIEFRIIPKSINVVHHLLPVVSDS